MNGRVRDWRVGNERMANVSVYRESAMGADDVVAFGADHVVVATGCHWRRDGFGRSNASAIPGFDRSPIFTPDDVMNGEMPPGPVLLFDDDGFYYGSVMAETVRAAGRAVLFVTPAESRTVAVQTRNSRISRRDCTARRDDPQGHKPPRRRRARRVERSMSDGREQPCASWA